MPRKLTYKEQMRFDKWEDNRAALAASLPVLLTIQGDKATFKPLLGSEKETKKALKEAKAVERELFRLARPPRLSPEERKELRARQQRQRRAAKAISEAIL
jgi:hypothetical protein